VVCLTSTLRLISGYLSSGVFLCSRQLAELGCALAKLHSIEPAEELPPFPMGVASIEPFLQSVDRRHPTLSAHPFLDWLRVQLADLMPRLQREQLPQAMLHGDCFLDNGAHVVYDVVRCFWRFFSLCLSFRLSLAVFFSYFPPCSQSSIVFFVCVFVCMSICVCVCLFVIVRVRV
jgi:Phosphotransferase enzyme family